MGSLHCEKLINMFFCRIDVGPGRLSSKTKKYCHQSLKVLRPPQWQI